MRKYWLRTILFCLLSATSECRLPDSGLPAAGRVDRQESAGIQTSPDGSCYEWMRGQGFYHPFLMMMTDEGNATAVHAMKTGERRISLFMKGRSTPHTENKDVDDIPCLMTTS